MAKSDFTDFIYSFQKETRVLYQTPALEPTMKVYDLVGGMLKQMLIIDNPVLTSIIHPENHRTKKNKILPGVVQEREVEFNALELKTFKALNTINLCDINVGTFFISKNINLLEIALQDLICHKFIIDSNPKLNSVTLRDSKFYNLVIRNQANLRNVVLYDLNVNICNIGVNQPIDKITIQDSSFTRLTINNQYVRNIDLSKETKFDVLDIRGSQSLVNITGIDFLAQNASEPFTIIYDDKTKFNPKYLMEWNIKILHEE